MQEVNRAKNTWKNNCFTQILIKEWSSESNKIWFIISQYSSSLPLLEALPFLPLFKVPPPWKKIYSVQFLSVAQSCPTLCNPMDCSIPGLPVHHQLLKLSQLISIELVRPCNHFILCRPFSSCLQSSLVSESFPMSQFFTPGDQSIVASASASVLPMNSQDWFPLGLTGWSCSPRNFKSLLKHHSSRASILQHSAFFLVQLSHPYMTTENILVL